MKERIKHRVVIWGAGGHASVVADALCLNDDYELVGFLDDLNPERKGEILHELPIVGGRKDLLLLKDKGVKGILVGIGDGKVREELATYALSIGYTLITVVHPHASVARGALIGAGTFIGPGAIINTGAKIGTNVIINSGAIIEHDCVVEDGAHICPGAVLGGGVVVGKRAWVGIGSTIKDRMRIGDETIIGAGAVVTKHIPNNVTAYGVPARVVMESNG